MAQELVTAKNQAGPDILSATLIIPIVLIVAFGGLVIYMRSVRKKPVLEAQL